MSELSTVPETENLAARPPEDSPGGTEIRFRPDIEGLRAVAVTLVVVYHVHRSWLPSGFIGVDVFFVISGFLITSLLLKEHSARHTISIAGFYARRARRILPAAMIVISLTALASYWIQNFQDFRNTAADGRWASLFAANIHFGYVGGNYLGNTGTPSALLHYWSLAVEEQFYLAWPILILLTGLVMRRIDLRWRVATVATLGIGFSYVWSITQTSSYPTWAYFSPFTRAWELGLGALVAAAAPWCARIPRRWGEFGALLGLATIIAFGFLAHVSEARAWPGAIAAVPVAAAAMVIAGGVGSRGASVVLALRPVRSVGRVSYGWYLLHYPMTIIMAGAIFHRLSALENSVIALISLWMAYDMYRYIERPIRRSTVLARSPLLSLLMGAAFVGATFALCYFLHPTLHPLWLNS